jgi:exopolysaccharide biosynthesis polyprenyl glycosylphosphotransferase
MTAGSAARSERIVSRLVDYTTTLLAPDLKAPRPQAAHESSVSRRHRPRDYYLRRMLAAGDATALVVAAIAVSMMHQSNGFAGHLLWLLLTLPLWVALFGAYGLYGRDVRRLSHSALDEVPAIFHAYVIGSVGLWGFFNVFVGKVVFAAILTFALSAAILMVGMRLVQRRALNRLMGPERVLFVGGGETAATLMRRMRARGGPHAVGLLTRRGDEVIAFDVPTVGEFESADIDDVLTRLNVERVVVTEHNRGQDDLVLDLLRRCKQLSVKASLVPATVDVVGPSLEVDHIGGITVLGINPPVLSRSARAVKRSLDLVGAGLLVLAMSPVMAVIAIAIKLDSKGPVFFRQRRVGRGGRVFLITKFRSMVVDAEEQRGALLKLSRDPDWLLLDRDPRITRVGGFLRRTSLDELPQLLSVLRGDMSLVGPRPLIEAEDSLIQGWRRARVDLTPGLTGLWQVLGRTSIPFEEMVKLDYVYVTNWSLWGDVQLILRTLPVVISRRGAN